MPPPDIISSPDAMRSWAQQARESGDNITLVPTMGALHEGHLSLVRKARVSKRHGGRVLVSIFVNPSQFGPNEDLDRYPRTLEADIALLTPEGVDLVFAPSKADMYRDGFDTWVAPNSMGDVLCGASRPNHFRGVCTVVLLLFNITRCHRAVFGEKDFQQLQIIRRMVHDLWLDVLVTPCPTIREPDGLAMSSRNAHLSAAERKTALCLSGALQIVDDAVRGGQRDSATLIAMARTVIDGAGARVEYVAIVDPTTLLPAPEATPGVVCAIAAHVGATRLIDNRQL